MTHEMNMVEEGFSEDEEAVLLESNEEQYIPQDVINNLPTLISQYRTAQAALPQNQQPSQLRTSSVVIPEPDDSSRKRIPGKDVNRKGPLAESVVMRLSEGLLRSGRTIVTNNFYTKPDLCKDFTISIPVNVERILLKAFRDKAKEAK
ncbi:unnamed protein product, partial [Mesorhabditis belari]|uniref:Uncharacterized protein n=1 Tax=Mesorhabditis belari TaxID=2138241 RepID=A0AAF3F3C7_9BILA